jgi:hypothetical protein
MWSLLLMSREPTSRYRQARLKRANISRAHRACYGSRMAVRFRLKMTLPVDLIRPCNATVIGRYSQQS